MVEAGGNLARQFKVLFLILADRHMGCLVQQDVSSHQDRIGIEAERGHFLLLAGLFLELGHAVEPAHRGQGGEQPGKFGMTGNPALLEDRAMGGVDPGCDIGSGQFTDIAAQLCRVLRYRYGVQIDDTEDAVIVPLQGHPVPQRAEVIAKVQAVGWLHA